ncbi:hypothetical protein HJFPF1_02779 [Paramyrothecium foliicola]|nr:hypothetical protein HJFPF1_02779 [Paramyrothecium foliicola]
MARLPKDEDLPLCSWGVSIQSTDVHTHPSFLFLGALSRASWLPTIHPRQGTFHVRPVPRRARAGV